MALASGCAAGERRHGRREPAAPASVADDAARPGGAAVHGVHRPRHARHPEDVVPGDRALAVIGLVRMAPYGLAVADL
ncbi:hypothetical protein [Streptomyces sp. NPDC057580]|uniref:hypothetical protein n=1 Tax=Streptomyces sp. NPDC057580 TaxID=3346173 RepID=UPI003677DF08